MIVDGIDCTFGFQESFPMRTSVSSSDCQHRIAMSWPGVKDSCMFGSASKSSETVGVDHSGSGAAGGEQTGHLGAVGTLLSISSRHMMTWTLYSCEASADYVTTCFPADPEDSEVQTPSEAQRAYSTPSTLELDAMLAPQTPPMLRQLVHLSPPDSPPSALPVVRSPNHTAQLRSQGTSPLSSNSQLQLPSHHHHIAERQGNRVDLPRPASLLSVAFGRYIGDCSNSMSNFMDLHQACFASSCVKQDPRSPMRSISADGFDGNTNKPQSIVPNSSHQFTEDVDQASHPAAAIMYSSTPAPKPTLPELPSFLQSRPSCTDSALLPAAAPLDHDSTAATTVSHKASDDRNEDINAAPVLLPRFDLSRSALWQVGLPRGRPPLPPGSRPCARRLSLTSTLSSDLRLISTPVALGDEVESPYAAAGTGHGVAAGFGTPLSLSGAAASPFGRTPDPLAPSAFNPYHDGYGGSNELYGVNAGAVGSDVSGSCVNWGVSNWTQRTSPFASPSLQEEDQQQENEDWHSGVMDMDVGAVASCPGNWSAPKWLESHDQHQVDSGGGHVVREGDRVESAAAGITAAPMDDDELDDYYLNILCGGRDPLADFMQQERLRMQGMRPHATATQGTSDSSSGEGSLMDTATVPAAALTGVSAGDVHVELRVSVGQGQSGEPCNAKPVGVLGLKSASATPEFLSPPPPSRSTSLLHADTPAVGHLGHLLMEHDGGFGLGCALELDDDEPYGGLIEASSSPRVFKGDAHVLLSRITAPRAGCGAGGAVGSPTCGDWYQTGYNRSPVAGSQHDVCASGAADGVDDGNYDGSVFYDVWLHDDKAVRVHGGVSEHLNTSSQAASELLTAALHAEAAAAAAPVASAGPDLQLSLRRGDSRCHFHAVELSASCVHCTVADDVQQLVEAVVLGACFSLLEEDLECVWE